MNDDYNKPETITIDHDTNKIKKILFGLSENPIEWPSMKPITHPGGYFDVTDALFDYVKNGTMVIPGGYMADHDRCKLIYNSYVKLHNFKGDGHFSICNLIPNNPNKQVYKEILIEMDDGTTSHYSKWKTIKIINWRI